MDYWAVNNIYYYPGATWDEEYQYLNLYDWQESPVYSDTSDDDTKYGSCHGLLRRSMVGSTWYNNSIGGSRSLVCAHFSASVRYNVCARGCSDSL